MSNAGGPERSEENWSLSSFVNLVKMLQGYDETAPDFDWASYPGCVSLMLGARFKPGHPFQLPLGFPPEGPPKLLSERTVESIERRFGVLRDLRAWLDASMTEAGEPDAAVVREIGPQVMATVKGLGADLEVHRFPSGEAYVVGLKMRQAIPPDEVGNAQLVQILEDFVELPESKSPRGGPLNVRADRLIYCLPHDPAESTFDRSRHRSWEGIRNRIERAFRDLFPGNYATVELRDREAATILRGRLLGPTWRELERKRKEMKAKRERP